MSNQYRNPYQEAAHYQACRQAGEDASPDRGNSRDQTAAGMSLPDLGGWRQAARTAARLRAARLRRLLAS